MDDIPKKLMNEKIDQLIKELGELKKMISENRSSSEIISQLRQQSDLIYSLKSYIKAFSIAQKINQGNHDAAANEVGRVF